MKVKKEIAKKKFIIEVKKYGSAEKSVKKYNDLGPNGIVQAKKKPQALGSVLVFEIF